MGLILSKIGDLINKLCPNGVEYKELNTLINDKVLILINAPVKLKKENYKPIGEYPIIDQGHKFIIAYSDDKNALIKKDLYVIFGDHTELFKFVDFGFIQGADGIKILKTKQNVLNTKYFYYAVSNYYIQTGKYTRHFAFLKNTLIPIPPLEVQEEIVRILDTFTALISELKAELEARKKQYEYYRNKLLNFEGKNVVWKTLGEVCTFEYGKSLKESDRKNGIYPVMGSNGKVGYHDTYIVSGPCIIVGRKGSAGAINWVNENCFPIDTAYYINLKTNGINLRFLFQYLISIGLTPETKSGGVPGLNRNEAYQKHIPLPSLTEQQRIVGILDKFDTLVNDLSIGIPAEIEARQKQYEYYRGKLLSFKKLDK